MGQSRGIDAALYATGQGALRRRGIDQTDEQMILSHSFDIGRPVCQTICQLTPDCPCVAVILIDLETVFGYGPTSHLEPTRATMADRTGELNNEVLKLDFDRCPMLRFRASKITSDAALVACRELDDALPLMDTAADSWPTDLPGEKGGRSCCCRRHLLILLTCGNHMSQDIENGPPSQ